MAHTRTGRIYDYFGLALGEKTRNHLFTQPRWHSKLKALLIDQIGWLRRNAIKKGVKRTSSL